MLEPKFPLSDYYKDHVIEGITINRGGSWWTAVLLIEDPKTKEKFFGLYRWQLTEGEWKVRKSFPIKNFELAEKIYHSIEELKKFT